MRLHISIEPIIAPIGFHLPKFLPVERRQHGRLHVHAQRPYMVAVHVVPEGQAHLGVPGEGLGHEERLVAGGLIGGVSVGVEAGRRAKGVVKGGAGASRGGLAVVAEPVEVIGSGVVGLGMYK